MCAHYIAVCARDRVYSPGDALAGQKVNWSPGSQPDMPPKGYKTVICKFWENNMCAKGSTCTFAHGADELQRFTGSSMATGLTSPSPLKLDRYKTKLCLFHMQSRCSKGTHCPYAHGMQELRQGPPGPTSLSPLGADMSPAAFFPQQPQQLSQQSLPPQQQLSPQQQQQLMAQMDQQMLINLNVHSQQASSAMYAPNWGGNDEQQLQVCCAPVPAPRAVFLNVRAQARLQDCGWACTARSDSSRGSWCESLGFFCMHMSAVR